MKHVQDQMKSIAKLSQTQAPLNDQLAALIPIANKLGLYDAADYLQGVLRK